MEHLSVRVRNSLCNESKVFPFITTKRFHLFEKVFLIRGIQKSDFTKQFNVTIEI